MAFRCTGIPLSTAPRPSVNSSQPVYYASSGNPSSTLPLAHTASSFKLSYSPHPYSRKPRCWTGQACYCIISSLASECCPPSTDVMRVGAARAQAAGRPACLQACKKVGSARQRLEEGFPGQSSCGLVPRALRRNPQSRRRLARAQSYQAARLSTLRPPPSTVAHSVPGCQSLAQRPRHSVSCHGRASKAPSSPLRRGPGHYDIGKQTSVETHHEKEGNITRP